jgi:hypothetical protein
MEIYRMRDEGFRGRADWETYCYRKSVGYLATVNKKIIFERLKIFIQIAWYHITCINAINMNAVP